MDKHYNLDNNPEFDVETLRKRKKQLKKKKKKRRIKLFLLFILITGSIIGAGLSPLFIIKNINVKDTPHYSGDEIKAYIPNLEGENGFRAIFMNYVDRNRIYNLRMATIEDKLLKTLSYAEKVKVSFSPPSNVNISITERTPFAVVPVDNKLVLIDSQGYVLDNINENINKYIQINGISNVKTTPGEVFCDNPKEMMSLADKIMTTLTKLDESDQNKLVPQIISINVSDLRRAKLFVDSRLVVVLGDIRNEDVLMYRANYLRQLVFKFIGKKDKGTIDFTMGDDPRFIPDKME